MPLIGLGRSLLTQNITLGTGFTFVIDTTLASGLDFSITALMDPSHLAVISWGDGTSTNHLGGSANFTQTHTYASDGQYVVSITEKIVSPFHYHSFSAEPKGMVVDVLKWGDFAGYFMSYTNLNGHISAADEPDWSGFPPYNLASMFRGSNITSGVSHWFQETYNGDIAFNMFRSCSAYNEDISGWDTSGFTRFNSMFLNASSFDQNLGSWNISNITGMNQMIQGSGMSVENYSACLIGWAAQAPNIQNDVVLTLGPKYTSAAQSARNVLVNDFSWTINDGGLQT